MFSVNNIIIVGEYYPNTKSDSNLQSHPFWCYLNSTAMKQQVYQPHDKYYDQGTSNYMYTSCDCIIQKKILPNTDSINLWNNVPVVHLKFVTPELEGRSNISKYSIHVQ